MTSSAATPAHDTRRYVRAPSPITFPEEAEVPESKRHLKLRTLLFAILERTFAPAASVGSDQFVYWNAADPRRCVAPDAFVRLGVPDSIFGSWKTWERGAPDVAVEIASESDAPEPSVEEKLARYHEMGVRELVRFEPDAPEGARLRVWDRALGDLVERRIEREEAGSSVLTGFTWVVRPGAGFEAALRLLDSNGELLLGPEEAREAESRAREAESRARERAERRVAELEAELARRKG